MATSKRTTGPALSTVQALAIASQFGATLAVAVGVGLVAGQWLDGILHISLVFTLIGVFLGLITSATTTVKIYSTLLRRNDEAWRAERTRMSEDKAADDRPEVITQ